ncbi:UTP--glucose-1-phosphate uridylyltransferase [Desulfurella amilsii]|uniref:UTP--glucose-1-phosphate uridylyltransferase n=1 Tax=Desulfurella amilsii TaxID=1562698 RepID=A0A1X4XWR9_9BACT|nr:UTP--glucose-1-phosphate uridylyltransferase GalU [Desulfurella amilsii]OSS41975.1 UTP--glucose-1-phosphate uridylyltransferase [Desulfurella amilsii]
MSKIRKAVFPVAGFGTRFLPVTKSSPKEMLPLVDKPLIHYGVKEAVDAGIEQVILITGRGKRAIEDYFDISFELEFHLKINNKEELIEEMRSISNMADFVYMRQEEPKGLGHAILRAKDVVGNEPFVVILPDDVIVNEKGAIMQLMEVYNKYNCSVLGLELVDHKETDKYGIVGGIKFEENIYKLDQFIEKPKPDEAPSDIAIIGRYIFTPKIFEALQKIPFGKNNELQLTDAIKFLSAKEAIYGKLIEGKRFDCGSKLGFLKATVEFSLQDESISEEFKQYLIEVVNA